MYSDVGELNGACEATLGNTKPQFMEVDPSKVVGLRAIGFLTSGLFNSNQLSHCPHDHNCRYFRRGRDCL